MFGRKDTMDETEIPQKQEAPAQSAAAPRAPIEQAPRPIGPGPIAGRRQGRPMPERMRTPADAEERKLIVGKGLSLSGEIAACDILVVEGKIEAKLPDGKLLEITETGQFRGNVEIESADIAGRYDGELTVHGRLTIRGTGRVSGMVKYGELEVNAGGQIIGEMQVVGAGSVASGTPSFKGSAKFSATATEEEDQEALFSRKTAING